MATAACDSRYSKPRLILRRTFLEYVGVNNSPRENLVRSRTFTDSVAFLSTREINEINDDSFKTTCHTPETAWEGSLCSGETESVNEGVVSPASPLITEDADLLLSPAWSPWRRPDECADLEAQLFGLLPPAASSWCENPGWILQDPYACEATQFCMAYSADQDAYEWFNSVEYAFDGSLASCEQSASLPSALRADTVAFADQPAPMEAHNEECKIEKMTGTWWSDERVSVWADEQDATHDDYGFDGLKTTVMLRELPTGFTRAMMIELIESEGFSHKFDFVYVPVDFSSGLGLGYGFVNLISPADANKFFQHFVGFSNWKIATDAVCKVTWGEPCQGLSQCLERYRNSPVMHNSVEDEWKPIFFVEGARAAFPPPTKHIKAPKIRKRRE